MTAMAFGQNNVTPIYNSEDRQSCHMTKLMKTLKHTYTHTTVHQQCKKITSVTYLAE